MTTRKAPAKEQGRMAIPGVKILDLKPRSPAALAGLRRGDRLLEIDGHPIEDQLDPVFYLDEGVRLEVARGDEIFAVDLRLDAGEPPGWVLEPFELRRCYCRCIFCFIDQLPAGLRKTLYIKDEDYRFSFSYGNYLTLVGLSGKDYRRIFDLRLSPLYVSIHAVDPEVRGRLLGIGKAPVLPALQRLISGGIRVHGQIVLVPGINDGKILQDSLERLAPLYPGLASLSVVPVGLTKHRRGLTSLRLLTRDEARAALGSVRFWQEKMLGERGSRWVFPADELILRAGEEIPPDEEYEDYPQIENGVGMLRDLLDGAESFLEQSVSSFREERELVWVTGVSACETLKRVAGEFTRRFPGLTIEVLEVRNHLLGESVTVAGLLGGEDIYRSLREWMARRTPGRGLDAVFLPPNCVNRDGLLLDDWTPEAIARRMGFPVRPFSGDWNDVLSGEALR